MKQLPKTVMIDLTHQTLLAEIKELQAQRGLSNCEMELILTQVLNDVKTAKEADYAETILDLTYELQQREKESEEPVMTPVEPQDNKELDTSNMEMSDVKMTFDKVEITPEQE